MTPETLRPRPRTGLLKAAVVAAALVLSGAAWVAAMVAADAQRTEERARIEANGRNLALGFGEQVRRELLALDQTLRILKQERETDPLNFDLAKWQRRLVALSDLALQTFVVDVRGVVVASSRREIVGTDITGADYFEADRRVDSGRLFFGKPIRDPITNQWIVNVSRRLSAADGAFAGAVVVSYNIGALSRAVSRAELSPSDLIALIGRDGVVRALISDGPRDPGEQIGNSEMFSAAFSDYDRAWSGRSAFDSRRRMHISRPIPDMDLVVVVGIDEVDALRSATAWSNGAYLSAAIITLSLVVMMFGLLRLITRSRRREDGLSRDRTVLAASNAQLEAARRRAETRTAELTATIAGMSEGVSVFDGDFRLVQWNDRFAERSGVPEAMLEVGLPYEEILRAQARAGEFGPVDVELEVARRMRALRTQSISSVTEQSRADGRTIELRRSAIPGGGFVTLYTDITARKQAEEVQRHAREAAEAAAEEKSRFVAMVSHEIRTPLNVTLNTLTLLDQADLPAAQRRLVEIGLQSSDALMSLLNDILDLSRMEVGRLTLRSTTFALRPLLQGVVDIFRGQAAQRGIDLLLDIGDAVPDRIVTDAGRMRQILMNLVSNAAKFADPGPTYLRAWVYAEGSRSMLRLAVRDRGPLISERERARLFRPFSQLDRDRAAGSGTGLGLAICQMLAGLMGGRIGCDPTEDGGKEFWFTLGLEQVSAASEEPALPAALRPRIPRTRILLVEDVPANQIVIATLLRREGHLVDIANDGETAIRAVGEVPYDLVFMDIFMPGIGGMEAARRIRALPGPARDTPIVALTANISPEDRALCLAAGIDEVLAKPVDRNQMLATMAQMVWSGRAERASRPAPTLHPAEAEDDTREMVGVAPALDLQRIAGLRGGMPSGIFAGLMEGCLVDLRDRLPNLLDSLELHDSAGTYAVAHAMAGVAGSYGLVALETRLRRVMAMAQAADPVAALEASEGMAEELDRAEDALRELLVAEAA